MPHKIHNDKVWTHYVSTYVSEVNLSGWMLDCIFHTEKHYIIVSKQKNKYSYTKINFLLKKQKMFNIYNNFYTKNIYKQQIKLKNGDFTSNPAHYRK